MITTSLGMEGGLGSEGSGWFVQVRDHVLANARPSTWPGPGWWRESCLPKGLHGLTVAAILEVTTNVQGIAQVEHCEVEFRCSTCVSKTVRKLQCCGEES